MATWYHKIGWLALRPISFYRRIQLNISAVSHDKPPEPPYLLLANHGSYLDPYLLINFMPPFGVIVNQDGFTSGIKRFFATTFMRILLKQKGKHSFEIVEDIQKSISLKEIICIFPEGDLSWDGQTGTIPFSIAKLIKLFRIPVRFVKIQGSYCTLPRWATKIRHGKIVLEFSTLTKEKIQQLSRKEIHTEITNRLKHSDYKWAEQNSVVFKGNDLASNIDHLLWLCPVCRTHDSITGANDTIICRHCRKEWQVDANLRLSPASDTIKSLRDWYEFQKAEIQKICSTDQKDTLLTESINIGMQRLTNMSDDPCTYGNLKLFFSKMEFIPGKTQITPTIFPIEDILYFTDNLSRYSMFEFKKQLYRFYFGNCNSNKWILFIRQLQSMK